MVFFDIQHFTPVCCYSISSLKNLEVLDISWNNLSEGLPDSIFTSLLSLRKLDMSDCKILPNRCVLYYIVEWYCNKYKS